MIHLEISTAIWPLAAVQLVGLCCACLTRYCEGSRGELACRRCFLLLLSVVGLATMAAMAVSPGLCLVSGTLLAIMLLTATWDVGLGRQTSVGQ